MSKKRSKAPPGSVVQPLRVPEDMHRRIRAISGKARLSDADIMRMSIERGIGSVEKMFETPEQATAA